MAAAAQGSVTNKGVAIEYDAAGYEYHYYHTDVNGVKLYRYTFSKDCKGKAKVVNGKTINYQDHAPDFAQQKRETKEKAIEDRKLGISTVRVMHDVVRNTDPNVLPYFNLPALRRTVQRSVQVHGMTNWPSTVDQNQFNFPFLREDNCDDYNEGDPHAFNLLCSDFGYHLLKNNPLWSVDGTLFAAPAHFEQILITGVQEDHLFTPCAYAFLTTKTIVSYERVFRSLKAHGQIVNDPTTISYFEIGLSNGFHKVFPTTEISRCALHLYQANERLTQLYADANTKHLFKGILALSMLTPADMPRYFDAFKHEAMHTRLILPVDRPKVEGLFDYFERTYIGVKGANGRRVIPMHPMSTWSIHERIVDHSQIGTSTTEGFNAQLQV